MDGYFIREQIIRIVRDFFYSKGFHEALIPILNKALPLEPNLKPFTTTHTFQNKNEIFYLPMSPERSIKKMLGRGIGNCFAISPSFRNYERIGSLHSHEFIMLEWYRKNAVHTDIMKDVEVLLNAINERMNNSIPMNDVQFPRFSLQKLFKEKTGIALSVLAKNDDLMNEVASKKGYVVGKETSWHELFDQIFVNEIETGFPKEPFFLTDFPARISPLCEKNSDDPSLADRFELYINGVEIANGNTENTDTESIRSRFEIEHKKTGMPIDEEFLASLEKMKDTSYAGVGLGIDRLAMIYSGVEDVNDLT